MEEKTAVEEPTRSFFANSNADSVLSEELKASVVSKFEAFRQERKKRMEREKAAAAEAAANGEGPQTKICKQSQ